jgi:hypothetical protein
MAASPQAQRGPNHTGSRCGRKCGPSTSFRSSKQSSLQGTLLYRQRIASCSPSFLRTVLSVPLVHDLRSFATPSPRLLEDLTRYCLPTTRRGKCTPDQKTLPNMHVARVLQAMGAEMNTGSTWFTHHGSKTTMAERHQLPCATLQYGVRPYCVHPVPSLHAQLAHGVFGGQVPHSGAAIKPTGNGPLHIHRPSHRQASSLAADAGCLCPCRADFLED